MSELEHRASLPPGLWYNNPVLVQLFGLSPLLAVSATLVNGIGLGIATCLVLWSAAASVHFLRRFISESWRFVWYLLVLAAYTTLIDTLMQRFFFSLHRELGVYVPLICCNFAILIHLDSQRRHTKLTPCMIASARLGISFLFALILFSTLRELMISGTLGQNWQLLLPAATERLVVATDTGFAALQPGAFLLLGLLLAGKNWFDIHRRAPTEESVVKPVKRARVTGKP